MWLLNAAIGKMLAPRRGRHVGSAERIVRRFVVNAFFPGWLSGVRNRSGGASAEGPLGCP